MMLEKYFLLAMFVQVMVPMLVLMMMFIKRIKALQEGRVPARYYKSFQTLGDDAPKDLVVISRHFTNLFEMPILFLILGCLIISLQLVSKSMLVAAWLFVVFRGLHTIIHLSSNKLTHRLTTYALSTLILLVMWIMFIGKIFLS